MHPYLSEQVAVAHMADLRREAEDARRAPARRRLRDRLAWPTSRPAPPRRIRLAI